MKIYRLILALIFLLISGLTFGQKKDNINPYYNGHLSEYYNPDQTDFSKEYLLLQLESYGKDSNKLEQTAIYDFSPIWLTGNWEQNGVIGSNYQRIQFHIDTVTKSVKNPYTYVVIGKSKVNNNICNFKGVIKLLSVFLFDSCDYSEYNNCGGLFANYTFYEDSSQKHSGIYKGTTDCTFYLDIKTNTIQLDESMRIADGYCNRSFVGTWTEYKSNREKKCIWGDYRLPFTFDFDCGDGEMHVCDKYVQNGWQTYMDGSEYVNVGNGKFEIKNKWWIKKSE